MSGAARPPSAGALWRRNLPVWAALLALLAITLRGRLPAARALQRGNRPRHRGGQGGAGRTPVHAPEARRPTDAARRRRGLFLARHSVRPDAQRCPDANVAMTRFTQRERVATRCPPPWEGRPRILSRTCSGASARFSRKGVGRLRPRKFPNKEHRHGTAPNEHGSPRPTIRAFRRPGRCGHRRVGRRWTGRRDSLWAARAIGWRCSPAAHAGLEGARRDVEAAGGQALVIPTDMADADAVFAAADRVVAEWGRIDVWVNDAMATVFGAGRAGACRRVGARHQNGLPRRSSTVRSRR